MLEGSNTVSIGQWCSGEISGRGASDLLVFLGAVGGAGKAFGSESMDFLFLSMMFDRSFRLL